jgi:hypothetical protein
MVRRIDKTTNGAKPMRARYIVPSTKKELKDLLEVERRG